MITITKNICKATYYVLINYLLEKSDIFTFSVPNFGKYISPFGEERIVKYLDDGSEFLEYKNKVMPKIEKITDHLLKMYCSEKYGTNTYDREREIYVVKIDESLDRSFFENVGLFDWRYPNFPEDFCFYKNGQCVMELISHEELCFFFLVDDELLRFLDDINAYYIEEEWNVIPFFKI
jgi:hypothetical protein